MTSYMDNASLTLYGDEMKFSFSVCTLKPPWKGLHWEQPPSADEPATSKLTKVTPDMLKVYCLGEMMPLVWLVQKSVPSAE